MPRFDAVASLRLWAGEVVIGGRLLRVSPLPAADWLPVLMTGELRAVLRIADEGFSLPEILLSGDATVDQVEEQFSVLIESVTGRAAVTAFSLAAFARERWDVFGPELLRLGVRWDTDPIGRALDGIYGAIQRSLPEKELKNFVSALDLAEGGVEPVKERVAAPRGAKPLPATAEQYVRVRPKTVLRRPQDRPAEQSEQPTRPPELPGDSGRRSRIWGAPKGAAASRPREG